jgi:hypothetical protein
MNYDPAQRIPVVEYGRRCGIYVGKQSNPLTVAQYACKQLELENITGPLVLPTIRETRTSQYLRDATDWLLRNQRIGGRVSTWEYSYPWPNLGIQPPWRSALAEAFGALVLLVVGKREDARRHLQSLLVSFEKGGVAYVREHELWFLEFVCQNPPLVLNCMLHCLLILDECSHTIGDAELEKGFENAYRTLKRSLNQFDGGFFTYYDSRKNPADQKYHMLHVRLLEMLHERTGDQDLQPWISRWKKFLQIYPVAEPVIFSMHILRSKGALYL